MKARHANITTYLLSIPQGPSVAARLWRLIRIRQYNSKTIRARTTIRKIVERQDDKIALSWQLRLERGCRGLIASGLGHPQPTVHNSGSKISIRRSDPQIRI